jgi:hypothetical protein
MKFSELNHAKPCRFLLRKLSAVYLLLTTTRLPHGVMLSEAKHPQNLTCRQGFGQQNAVGILRLRLRMTKSRCSTKFIENMGKQRLLFSHRLVKNNFSLVFIPYGRFGW